jgi:hypothetical protein
MALFKEYIDTQELKFEDKLSILDDNDRMG